MELFDLLLLAAMTAALASVWHYVLTQRNHLLAFLRDHYNDVDAYLTSRPRNPFDWKFRLWRKFTRSVFECSYCLAGQLSVVVFLLTYGVGPDVRAVALPLFAATTIIIEAVWTGPQLKQQTAPTRPGGSTHPI